LQYFSLPNYRYYNIITIIYKTSCVQRLGVGLPSDARTMAARSAISLPLLILIFLRTRWCDVFTHWDLQFHAYSRLSIAPEKYVFCVVRRVPTWPAAWTLHSRKSVGTSLKAAVSRQELGHVIIRSPMGLTFPAVYAWY